MMQGYEENITKRILVWVHYKAFESSMALFMQDITAWLKPTTMLADPNESYQMGCSWNTEETKWTKHPQGSSN